MFDVGVEVGAGGVVPEHGDSHWVGMNVVAAVGGGVLRVVVAIYNAWIRVYFVVDVLTSSVVVAAVVLVYKGHCWALQHRDPRNPCEKWTQGYLSGSGNPC